MKFLLVVAIVFLFTSCSSKNKKPAYLGNYPIWMGDAKIGVPANKRVGIGCSVMHARGENAQKKLAIERAIAQVAMQKKSTVESVSYGQKSTNGGRYTRSRDTSSLQTVSGVNVKTFIKDVYKNPDGEICVRVVEE